MWKTSNESQLRDYLQKCLASIPQNYQGHQNKESLRELSWLRGDLGDMTTTSNVVS